jgi:hypothetical protein
MAGGSWVNRTVISHLLAGFGAQEGLTFKPEFQGGAEHNPQVEGRQAYISPAGGAITLSSDPRRPWQLSLQTLALCLDAPPQPLGL